MWFELSQLYTLSVVLNLWQFIHTCNLSLDEVARLNLVIDNSLIEILVGLLTAFSSQSVISCEPFSMSLMDIDKEAFPITFFLYKEKLHWP